jgi:hypothetical protein
VRARAARSPGRACRRGSAAAQAAPGQRGAQQALTLPAPPACPPSPRRRADVNATAYGGFDFSKLSVAYSHETDTTGTGWPATAPFYVTLKGLSTFNYPPPPVALRTLQGAPGTLPDGMSPVGSYTAGDNATLDSSRYVFYGPTSQSTSCPLATTATAPNSGQTTGTAPWVTTGSAPYCTTNWRAPAVANRAVQLVAYYGQYLFSAITNSPISSKAKTELSTTSAGFANGLPMVAFSSPLPQSEPFVVVAEVTGINTIVAGVITYNWDRLSTTGMMLYVLDKQGRVAPLFISGLEEWDGWWNSWYLQCYAATTCYWYSTGSVFSIGGSVVTLPTPAAPWRFQMKRDPSAISSWQPAHYHPAYGTWTGGPVVTDSQWPNWGSLYWSDYINNPTYAVGGAFSAANVMVGVFTSVEYWYDAAVAGTPTMDMTISRFYITSTIENTLLDLATSNAALNNFGVGSGSPCAWGSAGSVTVTRAAACGSPTGTACSVASVPVNTNGVNHTFTVVALDGFANASAPSAPAYAIARPTLPVSGAQLFMDAASLPSWLGAAPAYTPLCSASGSGVPDTCARNTWWPDVSGNGYLFGNGGSGQRTRPTSRAPSWPPRRPPRRRRESTLPTGTQRRAGRAPRRGRAPSA